MRLVCIFGYVRYWGYRFLVVLYHFGSSFCLGTQLPFFLQQELWEYCHETAIRKFLIAENYANVQWRTRCIHETGYGYGS